MIPLRELDRLHQYQTDKLGRCPINRHDYADSYEFHFHRFREQPITFWEIGVDRGDSLRLWSDYFPQATIVGIDLRPPTLPDYQLPPRTVFVQGNATDPEFIRSLAAQYPPDAVLDDGSHRAGDLRAAFNLIWPLTRSVYAVEDLGTQYTHQWGQEFLDAAPFTDLAKTLCDQLACNCPGPKRICWEPGQLYFYK